MWTLYAPKFSCEKVIVFRCALRKSHKTISTDPRDRGPAVAQVRGQEELEEVLLRAAAERAVPRDQAGRQDGPGGQGPDLPRLLRGLQRLPRRRLEEEVQIAHGLRFRPEAASG